MVINTKKCIGCGACRVACMSENMLPPGVYYRTIPEIEIGEYPQVSRIFMPTNCMQCDKPPCIKAVKSGAITKRPDGIVAIDYQKFNDKKEFDAAVKVCPYTALYYDDGDFYTKQTPTLQPYEKLQNSEYGRKLSRTDGKPPVKSGRKCHFCVHRLEAGMLPACVSTCLGGAMYFGDKNNTKGLTSLLIATYGNIRIKISSNTEPRVYYLTDDSISADSMKTCLACHGA